MINLMNSLGDRQVFGSWEGRGKKDIGLRSGGRYLLAAGVPWILEFCGDARRGRCSLNERGRDGAICQDL